VLFVLCHVHVYSSLAESFSLHFTLDILQSRFLQTIKENDDAGTELTGTPRVISTALLFREMPETNLSELVNLYINQIDPMPEGPDRKSYSLVLKTRYSWDGWRGLRRWNLTQEM
jgi:hypothetical protein